MRGGVDGDEGCGRVFFFSSRRRHTRWTGDSSSDVCSSDLFHHSVASWAHTWPAGVNGSNAYSEVIGGVADWGAPLKNVRGKDYPPSGFKVQPQHITVLDKAHPVTAGVDDFDIVDESYLWPVFEDSVHPLLRTNAVQTAENYRPAQAGHPPGSSLSGWYKSAERSPV